MIQLQTIKRPEYENDDYLFRFRLDYLPVGQEASELLRKISPSLVDYYEVKRQAFSDRDTRPTIFERFVDDRPSLNSLKKLRYLNSTIYTVACEKQNDLNHKELIRSIKQHLEEKPHTRRCLVRFANSFSDYLYSEVYNTMDVTCLSLIHYLQEGPKLVFRASDVKNELLVDLLTINEFFLAPVYDSRSYITASVYASTAQGIDAWNDFSRSIEHAEEGKSR